MKKIESLISSLPQEWKDKISSDFGKMKIESPTLIFPEAEKLKFTITAIVQPETEVRKQIFETVAPFAKLHKGLFLQPSEGYHFSIQWSDFMNGDLPKLTSIVKTIEFPPLDVDIKLLYPSKQNLFAVLIPKDENLWMTKIRETLTGYFNSSSFTPKLPEKLPLIWLSVARFTKDFDPMTLDQLVLDLPEKTIHANKFTFFLAKSDPFFTKTTAEIYYSKDF